MIIIGALCLFFVWLILITWTVITIKKHYQNLVSRTKKQKIDDVLDKLIANDEEFKKETHGIKRELKETINQAQFHLQKVGLLRFNPFERIAGEQSFVLAFLDKENSGIIINFIYTHDGLRVYSKKIKKNIGDGFELSEEEKKVIKESR